MLSLRWGGGGGGLAYEGCLLTIHVPTPRNFTESIGSRVGKTMKTMLKTGVCFDINWMRTQSCCFSHFDN